MDDPEIDATKQKKAEISTVEFFLSLPCKIIFVFSCFVFSDYEEFDSQMNEVWEEEADQEADVAKWKSQQLSILWNLNLDSQV